MPHCPVCDHANSSTATYCSACGAALDNDPPNPYADKQSDMAAADQTTSESSLDNHLLALLREGKKIPAIKLYREQTGSGLKEAKEYVELLARRHGAEVRGTGCAGMLALMLAALAAIAAVSSGIV